MVDEIVTRQELIDAKRDARDLGKAVNEKVIVDPRYGAPFKSIPMSIGELQAAIEAAAAASAGANGWTDLLIQTGDGSTQRAKNSSFQSQIDSKASTIYVDAQDAVKADKSYVDAQDTNLQTQINGKASAAYLDSALIQQTQTVNTALSNLSTAATKFYPTLAEANADIANVEVNQPVQVGESANGGLWYKATADATTLTKSPYDPLTQAKADAAAKVSVAKKETLATLVISSSNLFNDATSIKENKSISTTGEIITPANGDDWAYSDFIAIEPNQNYFYDGFRYIAYYDNERNFIERADSVRTGSGTYPDPYKFTGALLSPSNAYFIRVIYKTQDITDYTDIDRKINLGPSSIPYEPFYLKLREEIEVQVEIEDNSISKEKLDFLKYSTNLFNHNSVTFGKIVSVDGILSDNPDYAVSDFIAVDKNKSYTISSETGYSAFVTTAFYDADKNFISRSNTNSSSAPYLIPRSYLTPNDVAFVRLNINVAGTGQPNQRNRMFNEGTTALPYEPYYEPRLEGVSVEISGDDSEVVAPFGRVLGRASGVNLDSETKTLTVSGRVFFQDGTNILGNGTASFDGLIGAPYVVVIDRISGGIRLVRTALHGDILPSEAIIGSFEPNTETLIGFPNGYTLNGIEVGGAVTGDPVVPRIPEIGWDLSGVYDAPPMPGYRPSNDIPMSTVDSFMIQSWFDGLASDHPEYITRNHLGDTATGLPVYAYRFKPDMGGSSVQPRVMIQGAIHAEAMSYVLPFHVMDLITNHWEDDPILEAFRWGLDITVIPVVNPYGVNNSQRQNSNGVDLNRNYPTLWTSGATHGSTFLSELETQYSFRVMKEFKPHIMLDMHYFGTQTSGETEGAFLWFPGFTQKTLRAGQSMINRMARKWKAEHPWMPPASVLDRGTGALVSPGAAVDTAIAMGAEAITFETGDRLLGDPSTSSPYSELAIKCGVEAVINYLMILLRR